MEERTREERKKKKRGRCYKKNWKYPKVDQTTTNTNIYPSTSMYKCPASTRESSNQLDIQHGVEDQPQQQQVYEWTEHRPRPKKFNTCVFLDWGTVSQPDTVSQRLMKSGDVEVNPGPACKCGLCEKVFTMRNKPVTCDQCQRQFCKTTCTGPRWKTEKTLQDGKPWKCKICKGEPISRAHKYNEGITPTICAAPKCLQRKLKAKDDFMVCTFCKKQYHLQKKCSDMSRQEVKLVDRESWKCPSCIEEQTKEERTLPTEKESVYADGVSKEHNLKILQLNIDAISSKVNELRMFLEKHDIDVFCIQETKMLKKDKTPKFPGYVTERKDRGETRGREKGRGGGLITGIKRNIPYKRHDGEIRGPKDTITEWISIEVPTTDKKKVRVTNAYVPPTRGSGSNQAVGGASSEEDDITDNERPRSTSVPIGSERPEEPLEPESESIGRRLRSRTVIAPVRRSRGESPSTYEGHDNTNEQSETNRRSNRMVDGELDLRRWPCKEYDIILGDTNAHSPTWDCNSKKPDKRGEVFEHWMESKNMEVFNRGDHTRVNRKEGGRSSAPDMSISHISLLDKLTWETVVDFGSDHLPIIVTYTDQIKRIDTKPKFKWKLDDANWSKFAEDVDRRLPKIYKRKNINKLEKRLRKAIIKAANTHVGKKRVDNKKRTTTTPEIKEAIKIRNTLKQTLPQNRRSWIDACKQVNELSKKQKETEWKEYVETLDRTSDSRKIWNTIRAMDGRATTPNTNEVLEVEGKCYITDEEKAKQFSKTYKGFSRIPTRKGDRTLRRINRNRMKTKEEAHDSESDLTMEEMMRAILGSSYRRASGDDEIPYEFLRNLGPLAQEYLLHLYNRIWSGEGVPTRWRRQLIKPLLKEGKDPKQTISYRPISLTSCLGKILERMIADRLIYILETKNLLNDNQAGFRQGRCTTDQILKLIQEASDGIHDRQGRTRTMVAFFDYEKAYDKVWRDGVIHKMLELGIPSRFVKYVRHFLSGRVAQVEFNQGRSKEFMLNEGLPQGSCISPIIFLKFINDIDVDLDMDTLVSQFADDTST